MLIAVLHSNNSAGKDEGYEGYSTCTETEQPKTNVTRKFCHVMSINNICTKEWKRAPFKGKNEKVLMCVLF